MVFIGLLVVAIGAGLIAGIVTQKTVTENKQTTTQPGIIPIVLPTEMMGFPTLGIGGVIALIGVAVIFVGFKFGF